jgi:hypothetical protein
MAKKGSKRREWTKTDIRELKTLARGKTPAGKIAKALKRTEGATRQKAFSLGVSLDSRHLARIRFRAHRIAASMERSVHLLRWSLSPGMTFCTGTFFMGVNLCRKCSISNAWFDPFIKGSGVVA